MSAEFYLMAGRRRKRKWRKCRGQENATIDATFEVLQPLTSIDVCNFVAKIIPAFKETCKDILTIMFVNLKLAFYAIGEHKLQVIGCLSLIQTPHFYVI